MAAIDRIYSLYSYRYESSLEEVSEWGMIFMPSCRLKQMRENVAIKQIRQN